MNLHFLSFLMDVASWLVFGAIYSRYILKFGRYNRHKATIASIKITSVALLGGLIATAHRALPEYGFAFYHFFTALSLASLYSLRYFRQFRKYMVSKKRYLLRLSNNFLIGKNMTSE